MNAVMSAWQQWSTSAAAPPSCRTPDRARLAQQSMAFVPASGAPGEADSDGSLALARWVGFTAVNENETSLTGRGPISAGSWPCTSRHVGHRRRAQSRKSLDGQHSRARLRDLMSEGMEETSMISSMVNEGHGTSDMGHGPVHAPVSHVPSPMSAFHEAIRSLCVYTLAVRPRNSPTSVMPASSASCTASAVGRDTAASKGTFAAAASNAVARPRFTRAPRLGRPPSRASAPAFRARCSPDILAGPSAHPDVGPRRGREWHWCAIHSLAARAQRLAPRRAPRAIDYRARRAGLTQGSR